MSRVLLRKPNLPLVALSAVLLCTLHGSRAHAGEAYAQIGLPGAVVGYALTVNEKLGLRADAGTTGSMQRSRTESGVPFDVKAQYDRLGLFADYFPFGGRFRVTGGLTHNKAQLDMKSRFDGVSSVSINGHDVTPSANDYFNALVKFPSTMPYIGIGWGHQPGANGMGFVADLGVSIGRAKLNTDTNMVGKNYGGYTLTQADIDAKTAEVKDDVSRINLLPSVSVGLSYSY